MRYIKLGLIVILLMSLVRNVIAYEISEGSIIICDEHESRSWLLENGKISQRQHKPTRYVFIKISEEKAKKVGLENWQRFSASKKDDNHILGRLSRWYDISESPKDENFIPLPQLCTELYSGQEKKLIGIGCEPLLGLSGTTWRIEPNGFFHSYSSPATGFLEISYATYSNGKCAF